MNQGESNKHMESVKTYINNVETTSDKKDTEEKGMAAAAVGGAPPVSILK